MLKNFSHIYYEKDCLDYAASKLILKKFPKASLIEIQDHRDIFNRKRQDWRLQKESIKLILAKKKSEFLYPGSDVTPNFNHKHFYYNTLIMNCIYDCHYCYLQGMYPSANIVVFTNLEDYFTETDEMLNQKGSAYLSISYDTDLLAFENIVPYCSEWIKYSKERENLTIELRTKSANFGSIKEFSPPENFILAWTLSPQNIIQKYEPKTPSLKARLNAASDAMTAGWKVRICLDPVLMVEGWANEYTRLIDEIKNTLPLNLIHDISLGTFRMNKDYYSKVREMRKDSELIHFPYKIQGKMAGYDESAKLSALLSIKQNFLNYVPAEKIYI